MAGGRTVGGDFWGNMDYTLNVDTQKLGLWPGGFLKLEADTGFGSNVFPDVGAIVPVNTAALLPGINERTTALTNATFMQFLSPQFGLAAGKINTLDLSATEFYGDYRTQFVNAAFNFPMTLEQVPLSTFGGALSAFRGRTSSSQPWCSARAARRTATILQKPSAVCWPSAAGR